jgi:hypothetical protein
LGRFGGFRQNLPLTSRRRRHGVNPGSHPRPARRRLL